MNGILFFAIILTIFHGGTSMILSSIDPNQDKSNIQSESIIDLYNQINQKGSLLAATSLTLQAQQKLKTIDTVRLTPCEVQTNLNQSLYQFDLDMNIIHPHSMEDLKLIELRLQRYSEIEKPLIFTVDWNNRVKKFRFKPQLISLLSNQQQSYLSYDLTRFYYRFKRHYSHVKTVKLSSNHELEQVSIVVYSTSKSKVFMFSIKQSIRIQKQEQQRRKKRTTMTTCSKNEFQIDFDQFPWGKYVLAPKKFNAQICTGDCPNPLSYDLYPSNHAMLISLIKAKNPQDIKIQPSCVPVKLRPLSLLYYDKDELVIKYHMEMIVEECGCR
ncbi:unnamed protein product [Didymodactylos carnosus]|uniref:TGF-beta family profile domain-containing protein n=1 Tax=Didymodactylos carnosus TaxID=1234261 RepID=A0A815G0D0_9BILA|nr:unnamed protein product [Didymodactylos carnosus]CAF4186963.1 unnamed protein product [Didymodactylos carnosus]